MRGRLPLAGWIAFAAMAPGLAVSPLAGALLDRAGAARGIRIDLAASAAVAALLAAGVSTGTATPPVLLTLAVLYALTTPLSTAGVRGLLPRLVPPEALPRANALDTTLHAIVNIVAPPLAGAAVGLVGSAPVFLPIAALETAALLCLARVQPPAPPPSPRTGFLAQSRAGVAHVLRHPTLRGLALGYALNLVTWGIPVVAVPVALARHYPPGTWESVSGALWAGAGVAGAAGALAAGRTNIAGREVPAMALCMAATALAVWPLAALGGVAGLALGLALTGLLAGPIDVGVLTLRQRRTDPVLLGRVMAVSMSLNLAGFPIGAALGGMLAAWSLPAAFGAAALASLLAAAATWRLIPAADGHVG